MTTHLIAERAFESSAEAQKNTQNALRFITCGSVDDGKSTLIGRLLVDTQAVLRDHLAGVRRPGRDGETVDLALLTDGLSAEREQGITIDVAYRYFNTERRKFIIGDAPGHEQYTRNMITAASQADAAVVLVDATKLAWAASPHAEPALAHPEPAAPRTGGDADANATQTPPHGLLAQTRRHSLLVNLLRVPSIVFAINKLDAVAEPARTFARIRAAIEAFATQAGIAAAAIVPVSALKGWNVVEPHPEQRDWCGYDGPTLLQILEGLPVTAADTTAPLAFPVQWVEKPSASTLAAEATARPSAGALAGALQSGAGSGQAHGRRVFWGRVAAGRVTPGTPVQVFPSGQLAEVAQVLDHTRRASPVDAGASAGIVLDREVDVSRGDWLLAAPAAAAVADDDFDTVSAEGPVSGPYPSRTALVATVAWMDDEPLVPGRVYWALHGHRWVKAKVKRVVHSLNIHTLAPQEATQLEPNAIGHVELLFQEALPAVPYAQSRVMGALILVDTASHRTSAAVLVNP